MRFKYVYLLQKLIARLINAAYAFTQGKTWLPVSFVSTK